VIGIKHPEEVNGFKQDPIDGVSMAYTFADANAPVRKKTQYFENNASRGIYHDGWFACTFGPFVPWDTPSTAARLKGWNANNDAWELYELKVDGHEVARTTVKRTVPGAFTASETLDVGVDLGSPVSLDYFDRAPFKFDGKIEKVEVELK